jgi:hypothetical protein
MFTQSTARSRAVDLGKADDVPYDRSATTLIFATSVVVVMTLSTGVDPLDRKIDGGIHPGSIVAIVTPPEAQVEPLLCASIGLRPTQYFTTVKTEDGIRRQLEQLGGDPRLEHLEHVGIDDALTAIRDRTSDLGTERDVIVDVMDPLENDLSMTRYSAFLSDLSQRLVDTDSIGLFACLDSGHEPNNRELTLTENERVFKIDLGEDVRIDRSRDI